MCVYAQWHKEVWEVRRVQFAQLRSRGGPYLDLIHAQGSAEVEQFVTRCKCCIILATSLMNAFV
jgi:hypothetical protein